MSERPTAKRGIYGAFNARHRSLRVSSPFRDLDGSLIRDVD